MKIAVMGLRNYDNMGDVLIVDSVDYLVNNIAEAELVRIDMAPKRKLLRTNRAELAYLKLLDVSFHVSKKILPGTRLTYSLGYLYRDTINKLSGIEEEIKNVDGVIIACGMFKFSTQELDFVYERIVALAQKHGIPVMFDAMGVENYDSRNYRARKLKEAVNQRNVKSFTIREGKEAYEEFITSYQCNPNLSVECVGDPAYWAPEVFGLSRDMNAQYVGINLIRPSVFVNYGGVTSADDVERAYKRLLLGLMEKGVAFKLFCNGLYSDYLLGEQLVKELNLPADVLLPMPTSSCELVNQIISFRTVFAARLHAAIISYSFGIPFIGFEWTYKIRRVYEEMEMSEYLFDIKTVSAEDIMVAMKTIHMDENAANLVDHKERTKKAIERFVEQCS